MKRMTALVITGYHEKEAQFGSDVTEYHRTRRLSRGRSISFYAVRDNEGSADPVVEKVDREIRAYLAGCDPPDIVMDVHVGGAEWNYPQGTRPEGACREIDVFCTSVHPSILCRFAQALGQDHVFADVPFNPEEKDGGDKVGDWTIAETGLPTVYVEPYLWVHSIETRGRLYWHQVRQTARLLNVLYDAFASYRVQGKPSL